MDHDLFELFTEYSGLTAAEVRTAAASYAAFNQNDWRGCEGKTWEQRALQFYGRADGYVFDLINANQSKSRLRAIYEQFGHYPWFLRSGPEVLEFGGGMGLACSILRDLGRKVTYVDVEGPVARFARWYFAKTGQQDIEMLMTPTDRLLLPAGRQWDFIFTDSVIEHLVDPEATVETLAQAVRPGGVLYLLIDAHTVDPRFPMHRHVHLEQLLQGAPALASLDHVLHDGDGLNVFRRPAPVLAV